MPKLRVKSRPSVARCPYCHDSGIAEAGRRCGGCGTRYHVECANALGGRCATLGCERVLGLGVEPNQRSAPTPERVGETPGESWLATGACGLWMVLEIIGGIASLIGLFL